VLQEIYRLSPLGFGLAFAACSVGFLIGTLLAATVVRQIGIDRTIGFGTAALAAGGLGMCGALAVGWPSIVPILWATTMYLIRLGLAMPQAMAGALTPFPDRAGAASSLLGFSQQTSAAIVGAIVGHMLGGSGWPIAAPMAIMGSIALAVWAISRRAREASEKART